MNSKILMLIVVAIGCSSSTMLDAGTDATSDGSRDGSSDSGRTDAPLGCDGEVPRCFDGWDPDGLCCLTGSERDASCIDGVWACGRGFLQAECGRLDVACEGADAGPTPLFDDCEVTSNCTLTINTCCSSCSIPTADEFAAVNRELTNEYRDEVACPDGPVPCPECEAQPNPYLVATCDMSGFRPACAVVDFEVPEYAGCTTNEECTLQSPTCCACGEIALDQTIAVRNDARIGDVVCDGETVCPPCAPIFSERIAAACVAGLCQVVTE